MKLLLLTAITLGSLLAQDKPAQAAPVLTVEQKLKLRDAQVTSLTAEQKFSEYMLSLQKQIEAIPDYQRLKAANDAARKGWTLALTEVREEAKCAECELNPEKMTLSRPAPKRAKAEPAKTDKN